MKAIVKRYFVDKEEDLSSCEPDKPQIFAFNLHLAIGPSDTEGEDFFEVFVASATYLAHYYEGRTPAFLRHILLLSDLNVQAAVAHVSKYLSSLEEDSWYELAAKIDRVADWEYVNYRPSPTHQ